MPEPSNHPASAGEGQIAPGQHRENTAEGVSEGGFDGLIDGWMESLWFTEARRRHIRLPSFTAMPTPGKMERWLRRLGMTVPQYFRLSGYGSLRQFMTDNPGRPLVEWVGIILEWQSQGEERLRDVLR